MNVRRKTPAMAASFLAACLGTSALTPAVAFAAPPAEQNVQEFSIAPQPLQSALLEFSRQSQSPVVASTSLISGMTAPAVQGRMDQAQALDTLLAGSGLYAVRGGDGGWAISRKATADPQSGSAAGGGAEVEALIVTAQKREEDIQDVPIAISAFSQEDLTRSQVAGGPDLMTQVPNMTFTKTNFSSYSIQIRGIGTQAISATTDPAVAVAFNNTPFIRNRFFEQEFYDLQRVEVLRGPQGTLYGRNATAGVVNIISAKPKFAYEAKVAADVANYSTTRLEGMINIPLVEDVVALRLAGAWTKRDGYVWNEITGQPIDGRDLWSTRVSLRVSPSDRFDVNLIWEHFEENDDRLRSGKQLCHQDDRTELEGYPIEEVAFSIAGTAAWFSQGCLPASMYSPDAFEAPNGYSLPFYLPLSYLGTPIRQSFDPYLSKTQSRDLRVIESTVEPEYWAKSDLVELQFSLDLTEALTLSSETAYNYDELFSKQDLNRFNTRPGAFLNADELRFFDRPGIVLQGPVGGIFCDPQVGCADRLVAVDLSTARSRQFSQELRLSSDFDGSFNFSLGANFLRYDTEDKYYVFLNTINSFASNNPQGLPVERLTPYVPGEYDGSDCVAYPQHTDPSLPYSVQGCQIIDPNPIESLNDEGHNYFLSKNPYKLISYAVFGEAYYNVTETLKVTAGLRWTVDKKEAPIMPSVLLVPNTTGLTIQKVEEQEWREPTGRLTIDWKPDLSFTDETLLYLSIAHGYKAGGANPPISTKVFWSEPEVIDSIIAKSATKPKTFEPEFIDAFEVGAKNTLFDGRVTLNLTAFYYDYKDYQISELVDRSAFNRNFDATVWGLEIEADWRPVENLRLGFKGGYENTRVADGEQAVDLMDRTAGHEGWVVMRPFPTFTENCIVPIYVVNQSGGDERFISPPPESLVNGKMGPCEYAYALGVDPFTKQPYVPNPIPELTTYPGFDPSTAPNNGEGFFKDLGGNELPNAPHFTATITADYTVPLPSDWLMTLHTDLYYQSEAWTRIFNMEGYDKLKAYSNINLAAIFSNEDAGWKVMAYVKNVLDRDSITGAFLYTDDVGLTTNVFLTEPRLYGLKVTKEWNGGPWWTGANPDHPAGEPYPLTVELGGAIQQTKAPYDPVRSAGDFDGGAIDDAQAQNRDLDPAEGKEVRLIYTPVGSSWRVSAGVRFGQAKGLDKFEGVEIGDSGCFLGEALCVLFPDAVINGRNWSKGTIINKEDYLFADFEVGREFGLGEDLTSRARVAVRYAEFGSTTRLEMEGIPDWYVVDEYVAFSPAHNHRYETDLTANRTFEGVGPQLSWDVSKRLFGSDEAGHADLDLTLTGGVLFGKQKFEGEGEETATYYRKYLTSTGGAPPWTRVGDPVVTPAPAARSKSVTVPNWGASLGLSYEIQRVKIGAGYRWERYYDVLDVGWDEHKDADRTMDGPYFKLSVGFGG